MAFEAAEAADESRNIWPGSSADMAKILVPFAATSEMNLCTYTCEATIVSKAVLDIPSIGEHCALLHALY